MEIHNKNVTKKFAIAYLKASLSRLYTVTRVLLLFFSLTNNSCISLAVILFNSLFSMFGFMCSRTAISFSFDLFSKTKLTNTIEACYKFVLEMVWNLTKKEKHQCNIKALNYENALTIYSKFSKSIFALAVFFALNQKIL